MAKSGVSMREPPSRDTGSAETALAEKELGRRAMVPTTNDIGRETLSALSSVGTG
jgi:hypothetical protein